MKKFVYFVILIMILSLCPAAHADTDVITSVNGFIAEHASDPDGTGKLRYCADMKGGGTFNMSAEGESIRCWIADGQSEGESFYNYEFALVFKAPFDSGYEWDCFIEDENGTNTANGVVSKEADKNTALKEDEFKGDEYLYQSFMENAHNFRDALVLAIANDLNYYFDKNLDYFGINPQFFCPDGHSFGEWVYQKNATKQKDGTEKRQCTTCFATEERTVEGTMIQVPAGTVVQTPEKAPEVTPEKAPDEIPEQLPEEIPDYTTELVPEQAEDSKEEPEKEQKPAKKLPAYALPLGIALAVVIVGAVAFLVIKTKSVKKDNDDEDLFGM